MDRPSLAISVQQHKPAVQYAAMTAPMHGGNRWHLHTARCQLQWHLHFMQNACGGMIFACTMFAAIDIDINIVKSTSEQLTLLAVLW